MIRFSPEVKDVGGYNAAMETKAPFLTRRFDLALHFASGLHHSQVRKGTTTPYIAHLLSVCALVLENGGNEDEAIAALLHDAVEDQGGLPTLDTIQRLFGEPVAKIVRECSDSESADVSASCLGMNASRRMSPVCALHPPLRCWFRRRTRCTTPATFSLLTGRSGMVCGDASRRARRISCGTTANS